MQLCAENMFPVSVYYLSKSNLVNITKEVGQVQSQEKDMAKKKKNPPSKIKYDQTHRTVIARLPKEKREKLLAVLKGLGVALPQLLLHFINEYEIKVKSIEEAKKAGYEEAKNLYMITFPCHSCGKLIPITGKQAKEAASKYMTEHGWGHKECPEKQSAQE